jgi:hypothetical protein
VKFSERWLSGVKAMQDKLSQTNIQILFIHPAYAKYRKPFFEKFLTYYKNTTFWFMRPL